jgi:hypothetical protein
MLVLGLFGGKQKPKAPETPAFIVFLLSASYLINFRFRCIIADFPKLQSVYAEKSYIISGPKQIIS